MDSKQNDPFYSRIDLAVQGGYFCSYVGDAAHKHGFRHSGRANFSGVWCRTSERPALDEGRPATLVREFSAVTDDFGTLVEVPA